MSDTFEEIPNPLPIELAPGIFWLGQCIQTASRLHAGGWAYLVAGDDCCALVEAGFNRRLDVVMGQITGLIEEHKADSTGRRNAS